MYPWININVTIFCFIFISHCNLNTFGCNVISHVTEFICADVFRLYIIHTSFFERQIFLLCLKPSLKLLTFNTYWHIRHISTIIYWHMTTQKMLSVTFPFTHSNITAQITKKTVILEKVSYLSDRCLLKLNTKLEVFNNN